MSNACTCGRRRATVEDLERWMREAPADSFGFNPEWARQICWTKRGVRCGMRPVEQWSPYPITAAL